MKQLLLFLSLLAYLPLVAQTTDIFRNPTVGFEIAKPSAWHYATAQQNAENLRATKLNDQELYTAMLKYASVPMVMLTKFEEPYDDLNPSVKVNARPLGDLKGRAPGDIIKVILPSLERAFKDFQIQQQPTDVVVSGLAASYTRIQYTLQAGTLSIPTVSELWIIPRGDFFFMIGAGTRLDEKTGSRKEVAAIIGSIKIDH